VGKPGTLGRKVNEVTCSGTMERNEHLGLVPVLSERCGVRGKNNGERGVCRKNDDPTVRRVRNKGKRTKETAGGGGGSVF